jgi:hypothetical protein
MFLVGCGVLRREIGRLCELRGWPVRPAFLDPALHGRPAHLAVALTSALADRPKGRAVVAYGSCHPAIDALLSRRSATRTAAANCIETLLGTEAYEAELSNGAYFLLEDWARNWEWILESSFGSADPRVIQGIFGTEHTCLLCLTTPLSNDFTAEAEAAGRLVGLPVRWRSVSLEHLESFLLDAMARQGGVV